ncbi:MAG: MFS transporter, partial [Firmicutes bacterium]|nr:MFS transporter [Bacillota bacterium]
MSIQLGIKENRNHFFLLVLLNLFVGAMVGLERTIMPLLGEEEFGIKSTVAVLSFIVSFGFSKAIVNYFAGMLADTFGRKRILITGWGVGLL